MALENEILVGRYNRGLQKLLGMKGDPPSPQLSSEIVPHLPLFVGREERYGFGWDIFAVQVVQAAVALQNSTARIRNPAGSNVIAVLEKLAATSSIADQDALLENGITTDFVNASTSRRIDSRGRTSSSCTVSQTSGGAGATSFAGFELQAGVPREYILFPDHQLVILPGDGIQLRTIVANTRLTVTFMWRERFLEESERA